jgi:hypothetical protein
MAVELIKTGARIQDGLLIHPQKIDCNCEQSYDLHYSPGEAHRLKYRITKAKRAVNKSHADNHPDTVAP